MTIIPTIDYPESDGKPMAETPVHMRVMWDLIQTLIAWFASPRVYVWGNMFLYYVKGDPRNCVSPDVMVIKNVDRDRPRKVFKTWEERRGPCATIEVSSRKTRREDLTTKYDLYQNVLKVREYFVFDPLAEYLKPPLKGFHLRNGVYQPINEVDGRLPSKELGLHLQPRGEDLRLWNPKTEKLLLTPREALQEKDHLLEEQLALLHEGMALLKEAQAENERLRCENESLRKSKRSK